MTAEQIESLAHNALCAIAKVSKGFVHASRKGVVAGVHQRGPARHVLFRRVDGVVRMEVWSVGYNSNQNVPVYPLPPALERRAARMLDDL